jgi:acyl carrier protein
MAAEANFNDLKQLLIKNCMLRVSPDDIREDTPLFGPDSLGLDSIDALQMTVAIEQDYGIAIKDPEVARQAFRSLGALKEWLRTELEKSPRIS